MDIVFVFHAALAGFIFKHIETQLFVSLKKVVSLVIKLIVFVVTATLSKFDHKMHIKLAIKSF